MEQWKPVVGFEGYEVSDQGRVRSLERICRTVNSYRLKPRILKPQRDKQTSYVGVALCVEGVQASYRIHVLVLEAFVGPRPAGQQTRHLDGVRTNNRLTNLAWGTPKQNSDDVDRHGTRSIGSHRYNAKLQASDIPGIRTARAAGVPFKLIAAQYGVTKNAICQVVSGRTWTHVS
jgi:hypothetical protein